MKMENERSTKSQRKERGKLRKSHLQLLVAINFHG